MGIAQEEVIFFLSSQQHSAVPQILRKLKECFSFKIVAAWVLRFWVVVWIMQKEEQETSVLAVVVFLLFLILGHRRYKGFTAPL